MIAPFHERVNALGEMGKERKRGSGKEIKNIYIYIYVRNVETEDVEFKQNITRARYKYS